MESENFMGENTEINFSFVNALLSKLKSPNNEEREKAEEKLKTIHYDIRLFQCLFDIAFNDDLNISNEIKIQSILLIKNLIRMDVNLRKKAFDLSSSDVEIERTTIYNSCKEILSFSKQKIISLLYAANVSNNSVLQQLKEVTLLICDKLYPDKWEEINSLFKSFFEMKPTIENFTNLNFFDVTLFMLGLFYSILKQFSKKKFTPTKNKFYPYKDTYLNFFVPYYESFITTFTANIQSFRDVTLTAKCLQCMLTMDKIITKLLDVCYFQSDFHKEEKLLYMVKLLMDRTYSVLKQIEALNDKTLKNILHHNIYKIIKCASQLQTFNPIIFYKDLKEYINVLMIIIANCEVFKENTAKVAFFALYKVMNSTTYKEAIPATDEDKSEIDYSFAKTPQKKKSHNAPQGALLLTSPTKYRNFENELKMANKCYMECFKEKNLINLIDNLINKCPFVYKKETDNMEIEILSEFDEEQARYSYEVFSTNLMSFQVLYKGVLDAIIINFTGIAMKYIKEALNKLYSSDTNNPNYLLMDSIFNLINLLPSHYKNKIISINDMIDSSKYISYMETHISKSDLILKRYILTLSKWSLILISNEIIFQYFNNLILFVSNINNNYILIESCLCMKTILDAIDMQMCNTKENINTNINKETFLILLKTKIDWGNLLAKVTNILCTLIPRIESSELIVALVKFFTSLILKSHYQNNGKILNVITNSKLMDIVLNCKDEFTENVYIKMYESLVYSYGHSFEICQMALQYAENLLRKSVNANTLSYILLVVKKAKETEENKKMFFTFLKNNFNLFTTTTSQSLLNLLISILGEIVILDVLDVNDITNIIDLLTGKYAASYETFKNLVPQIKNKEKSNIAPSLISNIKLIASDLYDSKSIILKNMHTILLFYNVEKKINLSTQYREFFKIAFAESKIIYENSISAPEYVSELTRMITRLSLYNFELFQEVLSQFLSENNITVDFYFDNFLNILCNNFYSNYGDLNLLLLCKILPLLNYEFLVRNEKIIYDEFLDKLRTYVYRREMNHMELSQLNEASKEEDKDLKKSDAMLLRFDYFLMSRIDNIISDRMENLELKDDLRDFDLPSIFIESLKRTCASRGVTIEQYIENLQYGKEKLKQILMSTMT